MRLLIDRGGDRALLKMRGHLRKQVGGDQFYFSSEAAFGERAADGQTVHGVDINSGESGDSAQKFKSFLKTFFFVFVAFNDAEEFPARTMLRKHFCEAVRFFAVIFGA